MNAIRRGYTVAICVSLGAVVWASGCLDAAGPGAGPREKPSPLVVSDLAPLISPAGSRIALSLSSTSEIDVAYVSLPPGTSPEGAFATIRNRSAQTATIVPMDAGGFDPVAVRATVGDTITVVVRDASGAVVLEARSVVATSRRPVVVRTDPPPRKRDVPLNAAIVIVFSEPIDAGTVTAASIQLRQGAASVAGQLEFLDPEHLVAAFVPAAPLAAGTDYQLTITQGIRDLDAESLETPVTVEFTTASASAPVASVTVDPPALTLAPGETFSLTATAYDSAGYELAARVVTWVNGDTTVATVSTAGVLVGVSPGTTMVRATVEGQSATATINVVRSIFASVSAGYSYSCGVTTGGAAYCWGSNEYGQLGNGSTIPSPTPTVVAGGLTFTDVSAGVFYSCGLTTGGSAYCWGGDYGSTPVGVATQLTFTLLGVGGWGFVCGLTPDGAAYCWGENSYGELGTGTTTSSPTPVPVAGGITFTSFSAGLASTCGVATSGTAYCWGYGAAYGSALCELDEPGYTPFCTRPMVVPGGIAFATASPGDGSFFCGTTGVGTAYCWGAYPARQWSETPVPVPGGLTFGTLSVDASRACGVAAGGSAYCWGWIPVRGEFSDAPAAVPGGVAFAAVSVGWFHTCGVTPAGTAYCWGENSFGQLGNGSQVSSVLPLKVAGQP